MFNRKSKTKATRSKKFASRSRKKRKFSFLRRIQKKQLTTLVFVLIFASIAGILLAARASTPAYSIICPLDGTSLPYSPQPGQRFADSRSYGGHTGLDFGQAQGGGAYSGAPVRAATRGKIVRAGNNLPSRGGYGNRVELMDSNGVVFTYSHLSSIRVKTGQTVAAGTVLGGVGNTGGNYPIHLHFEIIPNGNVENFNKQQSRKIDPLPSINKKCKKHGDTVPQPSGGCGYKVKIAYSEFLRRGESLTRGRGILSKNKRVLLVMQSDGNLVLYDCGKALWSSGSASKGGYKAVMQKDGNFVIYTRYGKAVGSSQTYGKGKVLKVQDDGKIVIYSTYGTPLWIRPASGGCGYKVRIAYREFLRSGESLTRARGITSKNKRVLLVMQKDGNLVLYDCGKALWSSGSASKGGHRVVMQKNGNLVIRTKSGKAVGSSRTRGQGNVLKVQDDGKIVIYSKHGTPLWSRP